MEFTIEELREQLRAANVADAMASEAHANAEREAVQALDDLVERASDVGRARGRLRLALEEARCKKA